MPATIVQSNAGSFNATSGNATLGAGTTAGNTLLLIVGVAGNLSPNPPTGFTPASGEGPTPVSNKAYFYRKSNVSAGETSWAIGTLSAQMISWVVMEVDGLDLTAPKDVATATFQNGTGVTSQSTSAAPISTTYDAFVVAAHMGINSANTTIPDWSGHTSGFVEVGDAGIAAASTAQSLSVSTLNSQQLATFSCTATASVSVNSGAALVVYSAANAKRVANVQIMAGFEWGTAAGLATGTGAGLGNQIFDTIAGSPAIVTTNPRSGSYCLECASSAATEYAQWQGSASIGSGSNIAVLRACVYFPSALPGADVDLFSISTASGATNQMVTCRYRTAGQNLGLQVRNVAGAANGTEQFSASTVAADTWYGIDVRFDGSSATLSFADWQIDGVDQTQATVTTTATQAPAAVTVGWQVAVTATVRYDDVVLSRTSGHYPLGDFRVLPLGPDPAGTLTISGTTANFQTFSANGTMAAWNAAAARTAISDLPPTIGASADGIAQITAATADYVEIPMQTRDAAGNGEVIRAVRMYACGWAASATSATIGFRGWEGSAETTLLSAADPLFQNSTTAPSWVVKMFKPTGGWTQAKLDALAFRVGFSGDATPDIGIHSIMAEVALRAGQTQTLSGDAATVVADPDSQGIVSITTAAPAVGVDTSLYYETNTTPTTVTVPAGTTSTQTVNAPDAPTTNYIAVYWPPEGVPDA